MDRGSRFGAENIRFAQSTHPIRQIYSIALAELAHWLLCPEKHLASRGRRCAQGRASASESVKESEKQK